MIINNESCKIVGIDNAKIKMLDGNVRTLSHIRHVPGINMNVISLITLDSKRFIPM